MCELGKKLENVRERSKAGQKLYKEESRERNLKASGANDRGGAKGTFCPRSGISHWTPEGPREKKKKRKTERSLGCMDLALIKIEA